MRRFTLACGCLLFLAAPGFGQVQLTENWDSGNSIPTSSGSAPTVPTDYTTSSGTWTLFRSYRHSTANYSAPYSARLLKDTTPPTDTAYLVTPLLNSVGDISFYAYASSAKPISIYKSLDSGATWSFVDSVMTGAGVFAYVSLTLNDPSPAIRLKIQNGTGSVNDQNIDDIAITGYSTASNIQTSASSLPSFGSVVGGSNSASAGYIVGGANLTDDITVTAPAGFEVSGDDAVFSGSLVLAQSGGTVPPTTVYARFSPPSAAGTASGFITHASPGAAVKNVSVAGVAVAAEPTTQSALSFGTVTGNSIAVNFTGGDGARRVLAARSAGPVSWSPTDGAAVAGVNSNFISAGDQGGGNRVVYDGPGSAVIVTGLTQNTTYQFAVWEYNAGTGNSQNYLTASPGTGSQATQAVPTIDGTPAALSFGGVEAGTTSAEKTYSLSASSLTPASGDIGVTAPSGFEVSVTSGSGFDGSLSIPYTGGALGATTVFVRFAPLLVGPYGGAVTNAGGGASDDVAVSGNGVAAGSANEFEAEDGLFNSAYVLDEYAGFSGTGYVDIADKDLAALEILFRRAGAATDSITVTFANGGSSRAYAVTLNGATVGPLMFPSTGGWTTWSTVGMTVPMAAGVNRLRFASTTNGGNANIDKIFVHGQVATPVYQLRLAKSGEGSLEVSPSRTDSLYDDGETVTLTATPSGGNVFHRWGGTEESVVNPFILTMTAHKTEFGVMIPTAGFGAFPYQAAADAFASVNALGYTGGTTGGSGPGMQMVYVTDAEDLAGILKRRVDATHSLNFPPLTIYVIGTLTPVGSVTDMLDVKDLYDVSIIGAGVDAALSGFGLNVVRSKNVVIRNLTIQNSGVDGISLQADDAEGTGNHVWIDHCTITNCYDGALDVTHTASYVTLSWNRFHHHDKNSLVGHSDGNTSDTAMKVTYHHNYFDSTTQRNPRVRFGDVHVYNNYYRNNSLYGVSSNLEADVVVEGNYFINVPIPTEISRDASPPGDVVERHNLFVGSGVPGTRGTAFDPSAFYMYSLDSAADLPALVSAFSGAGRYDFSRRGTAVTTFALSVSASRGSVTKNPDQVYYDSGCVVELTAVPNTGYHFTGWDGDLGGSANPEMITMNADRSVTALFAPNQYALNVAVSGSGSVLKNPDKESYDYGDSVLVTAVPDSGHHFFAWTGDRTGSANPIGVVVDTTLAVTAVFEPDSAAPGFIVGPDWNMVSLPVVVPDNRKSALFPGAVSQAFRFDNGYIVADSLVNGAGYWLKFTEADTMTLAGTTMTADTIAVTAGWNMIGSISRTIPVSEVSPEPGVSILTPFYRFDAGYFAADSIRPGKAYWVKTGAGGVLYIGSPAKEPRAAGK